MNSFPQTTSCRACTTGGYHSSVQPGGKCLPFPRAPPHRMSCQRILPEPPRGALACWRRPRRHPARYHASCRRTLTCTWRSEHGRRLEGRAAFLCAFVDEVKRGDAHAFFVRYTKFQTIDQRREILQQANAVRAAFRATLPPPIQKDRQEVARRMMKRGSRRGRATASERTNGSTIRLQPARNCACPSTSCRPGGPNGTAAWNGQTAWRGSSSGACTTVH